MAYTTVVKYPKEDNDYPRSLRPKIKELYKNVGGNRVPTGKPDIAVYMRKDNGKYKKIQVDSFEETPGSRPETVICQGDS